VLGLRLGDGTNGIHVTPVDVAGLSSSVATRTITLKAPRKP
jgi:hypothetical protein